ncbi:serine protease [Microbispora sp. NPDC049125]|uniref:trypsin-like serine peptidase n=1 Tax=Microbispora sp. NPDC049125 TaxID=3154929 RepID=UPI00346534F8
MKRSLALGGIAAGLLASAAVAVPAHADSVPSVVLANTPFAAKQVAAFWYGENKANLIGATPYNVETKVVAKHVSGGGPSASTKPGTVPAIGDEKKSTSKSKNVNLPKTTGKVFFIGADHRPHWCTATSVQSSYHNLVATAGHCVYDTESNRETLDKWVFIPGYYQGKTPWGIYVGKQAFTHYDYDVYEDGDRDYAFVTVYNGVLPTSAGVTNYSKVWEHKWQAYKDAGRLKNDKSTVWSKVDVDSVGDPDHLVPVGTHESDKFWITTETFAKANPGKDLKGDGPWDARTGVVTDQITGAQYNSSKDWYVSQDGKTLYWRKPVAVEAVATPTPTPTPTPTATAIAAPAVTYTYYKRTFWGNYDLDYKVSARVFGIGLKDVGRLGDNVGGQGLAYNQKLGKNVFVFGYPSGSHPDGNYAYTGKTLKWSYGKTFAASASAIKAEELVGVKSSFTGEGSIGSSWLLSYSSNRRLGYLNGVTIGVSDTDKNNRIDTSVSPYFDGELYGVYSAAKGLWSGKIV